MGIVILLMFYELLLFLIPSMHWDSYQSTSTRVSDFISKLSIDNFVNTKENILIQNLHPLNKTLKEKIELNILISNITTEFR